MSVKGQQPLGIGEVHDPPLVSSGVPVLATSLVFLFGIIQDIREPDGILGKVPAGDKEGERHKQSTHGAIVCTKIIKI